MYTSLSSHYLEAMGIQVWRPRQQLADASPKVDFARYLLQHSSGELAGTLYLETKPLEPAEEASMWRLLDAMLAAIHLKRQVLTDLLSAKAGQFVLLMGESLAQQTLGSNQPLDALRAANIHITVEGLQCLVTYHPLDLLRQPADKAKAWEDLKKRLA